MLEHCHKYCIIVHYIFASVPFVVAVSVLLKQCFCQKMVDKFLKHRFTIYFKLPWTFTYCYTRFMEMKQLVENRFVL